MITKIRKWLYWEYNKIPVKFTGIIVELCTFFLHRDGYIGDLGLYLGIVLGLVIVFIPDVIQKYPFDSLVKKD